jgi:hypothetical protein
MTVTSPVTLTLLTARYLSFERQSDFEEALVVVVIPSAI